MGNDLLYKLAYDEGVRALSEQQAVIDSFRTRSGLLLSAAAITTSFLGAQALQGGNANLFAWVALGNFVAVAAVALAILWPYRWEFTASPHELVEPYIELAPRPRSRICTESFPCICMPATCATAVVSISSPFSFSLPAVYWQARLPLG